MEAGGRSARSRVLESSSFSATRDSANDEQTKLSSPKRPARSNQTTVFLPTSDGLPLIQHSLIDEYHASRPVLTPRPSITLATPPNEPHRNRESPPRNPQQPSQCTLQPSSACGAPAPSSRRSSSPRRPGPPPPRRPTSSRAPAPTGCPSTSARRPAGPRSPR